MTHELDVLSREIEKQKGDEALAPDIAQEDPLRAQSRMNGRAGNRDFAGFMKFAREIYHKSDFYFIGPGKLGLSRRRRQSNK